ncbi:hypothetical protein BKA62DRAFT_675435 [Auriculariales sp. MPI-PUGE-AT-0066]|nr:hypothetical protein BKA62DRAFT_675435 [Auriculariales sp. MPI-PUGE-AT-0066]
MANLSCYSFTVTALGAIAGIFVNMNHSVANGTLLAIIVLGSMLMGCLLALSLLRPALILALAIALTLTDAVAAAFAAVFAAAIAVATAFATAIATTIAAAVAFILRVPKMLENGFALALSLPLWFLRGYENPCYTFCHSFWSVAKYFGLVYPMPYLASWFAVAVIHGDFLIPLAHANATVFVAVQYMLAQFCTGGPGVYSADRSSRAAACIFISGLILLHLDTLCSQFMPASNPLGSSRLAVFACTNVICALFGRDTSFPLYISMLLEGPIPDDRRRHLYEPLADETVCFKSYQRYRDLKNDRCRPKRVSIVNVPLTARTSLPSSNELAIFAERLSRQPPSSTTHERMERHSRSQRAQLDYVKPWQHPAYHQPQFCPTDRRPAALIDHSRKNGAAQPVTARAA